MFKVANQDVVFETEPAAKEFLVKGLCPVRPEEFEISRDGKGICGDIVKPTVQRQGDPLRSPDKGRSLQCLYRTESGLQ